jgi:hypothetical protein
MFNKIATAWFRLLGGKPCFRIHGKARREASWRVIDVFATSRRDLTSRWPSPLFRGTLITWTASVISLGWDCAETILREQWLAPASREHPVEVPGGRVHPELRPGGAPAGPARMSEVLAHECGHTWQALRLGVLYLPAGALFTWWREGRHWWNAFENQASAEGQFGGIVSGSVCPELMECVLGGP